jgi:hypothetical protein
MRSLPGVSRDVSVTASVMRALHVTVAPDGARLNVSWVPCPKDETSTVSPRWIGASPANDLLGGASGRLRRRELSGGKSRRRRGDRS